ncbi:MAG TPA: class I SAM-dependent methyltransferase [Candidatus Acetothermia bacterium]|nr:class I SAM-dependent methyltransferase [Candidatus Acetothermia bacterium]
MDQHSTTEMFFESFCRGIRRVSEMSSWLCPGQVVGAEVGVHKGINAEKFLEGNPRLHLHLVDLWELHAAEQTAYLRNPKDVTAKGMQSAEYGLACREETEKRVERFHPRYTILRMSSAEAATNFQDGFLDFVYIDAGHQYENCRDDIRTWIVKVRVGGYVCGHDYSSKKNPGVRRAVDKFAHATGLQLRTNKHKYSDWVVGPIADNTAEELVRNWEE